MHDDPDEPSENFGGFDELLEDIEELDISPTRDESVWIERLSDLLQHMPPLLWLFVDDAVHVMKLGQDGERAQINYDAYDQRFEIDRIDGVGVAGGEW